MEAYSPCIRRLPRRAAQLVRGKSDRFQESALLGSENPAVGHCNGSLMTEGTATGAAPMFPAGEGLPTPEDLAAVGSYLAASQSESTRRGYGRDMAAGRSWGRR